MFVFSQLLVQEIASGFILMYAKTCVSASIMAREHAIINIESKWSPIGSIDSTLPSSSLSVIITHNHHIIICELNLGVRVRLRRHWRFDWLFRLKIGI